MKAEFTGADAAIDYLFASFGSRYRFHAGKLDREYRRPEILMGLARNLNVLPNPSRTCLVTGSKGKGTVSRMISWNLAAAGLRVGLVVTPEEIHHLDRIRIGNTPIPESEFCRIAGNLRHRLDDVLAGQPDDFYFAPTGLFLLVALVWFQEQGVDAWVIEGGRGAKFDEIGQIEARVGVVTNVLPEHILRLGPTIEDIAADKLSLSNRCQTLVIGASVLRWAHLLPGDSQNVQAAAKPNNFIGTTDRPQWFDDLEAIAQASALHICPGLLWRHFDTPAFFFAYGGLQGGRVTPGTVCCDAAIHPDCLDTEFLRRTGFSEGAALIGLSEDKDGEGMVSKLTAAGFRHLYTVGLSSRIGHIRAWEATDGTVKQIAEIEVIGDAESNLQDSAVEIAKQHGSLYVVGVQVFIRSMRHVLNIGLMDPQETEWKNLQF